jgi:hypothetical protein
MDKLISNTKNDLQVKIDKFLRGIYLNKDGKEKFVKITGDSPGDTFLDSLIEGAAKGMGCLLTLGSYPLLAGAFKSAYYIKEIEDVCINKLGEKNEDIVLKVSTLGGLLGFLKGSIHGLIDTLVIGGLTLSTLGILGPYCTLLFPVIGGVYNVTKDTILKKI